MNILLNINDFLYHSTEVLICDIKLFFLKAARQRRLNRIAELKAELVRRGVK